MNAIHALGAKHTCGNPACVTRFHDMNKRPAICPRCKQKVAIVTKVYSRRRRRTAGEPLIADSLAPSTVIVTEMPKRAKRRAI